MSSGVAQSLDLLPANFLSDLLGFDLLPGAGLHILDGLVNVLLGHGGRSPAVALAGPVRAGQAAAAATTAAAASPAQHDFLHLFAGALQQRSNLGERKKR